MPGNITAAATSASGAMVTYSASATDPVDGSITPVCTPASGSTFALGTTTVTCTATDAAGNESSASFTVTVVPNIGSFAIYATEAVELRSNSSVTGCNVGVENTGGPFLAGGAAAYLSSRREDPIEPDPLCVQRLPEQRSVARSALHQQRDGEQRRDPRQGLDLPGDAGGARGSLRDGGQYRGHGERRRLEDAGHGAYGSVTVNSGATLKLTGGTYVFSSLTLSSGATLAVSAPTVLSVTGAASFSSSSSLGPASGSGLTAKALAVYFDGSSGINVTSGAKVRALLVAPKALVTVSTSSFTGAITAAQVLMNAGATVTCEDGLGSLPGQ